MPSKPQVKTTLATIYGCSNRRNGVWINLSPSDRREEIRVDEASIGAIGTLWLVDYYHRHPEMRFELSGAAVLERLNSVFVTEVENRDV